MVITGTQLWQKACKAQLRNGHIMRTLSFPPSEFQQVFCAFYLSYGLLIAAINEQLGKTSENNVRILDFPVKAIGSSSYTSRVVCEKAKQYTEILSKNIPLRCWLLWQAKETCLAVS